MDIEEGILKILSNLTKIAITSSGSTSEDQQTYTNDINDYILSLQDLDSVKQSTATHIPKEVLQYMEDGINPEIYSAIQSQNLIDKNQKSAGKIKAYEKFNTIFQQKISKLNQPNIDSSCGS